MLAQSFMLAQIKENIKAPRHWPLRGEFSGDRWIPRTKASHAENISIWWRHHDLPICQIIVCLTVYWSWQWRNDSFLHTLQWRHNESDGAANYQPRHCLLNRLVRRKSKKTSKLRVTGLCAGNSPVTGEFPAQLASNAENVSIWWRHHAGSAMKGGDPSGFHAARLFCTI